MPRSGGPSHHHGFKAKTWAAMSSAARLVKISGFQETIRGMLVMKLGKRDNVGSNFLVDNDLRFLDGTRCQVISS